MKITVLIENEGPSRYETEHGLALHIEYNRKSYLLDSGASAAFMQNANLLGIDLKEVDTAILSHAHYDHSGGFEGFFQVNKKAKVYIREEAKAPCYSKILFSRKYIGIPEGLINTYENRFEFINDDMKLDDGVWLLGHKTRGLSQRGKAGKMYRQVKGELRPDNFSHEQSLVFETKKGLVILSSCSHAGIENVVNEVKDKFYGVEVNTVIGGLHLMGLRGVKSMGVSKENVLELAETIKYQNVNKLYTGHCTGAPAFKILKDVLGEKLEKIETGTVIEI